MNQFANNAPQKPWPISGQNAPSSGPLWTCPHCTYQNAMNDESCSVCETTRDPDASSGAQQWTCVKCEYRNPIHNDTCQCCQSASNDNGNGNNNGNMPAPNPTLTTSHSTPYNLEIEDHVLVTPMGGGITLGGSITMGGGGGTTRGGPDHDIYWICSQCTFTNIDNLMKCDLCDAPRFVSMTVGTIGRDIILDLEEEDYDDFKNSKYADDDLDIINDLTSATPYSPHDPDPFGYHLPADPSYEHFESALNIIVAHAPSHRAAITVLKSLKKITERVSDENPRYRVLDTQTRGVQRKLLGFEGSLEYLQLLGYTLDDTQTKLQCMRHPAQYVLDKVVILINVLLKSQRDRVLQRVNDNEANKALPMHHHHTTNGPRLQIVHHTQGMALEEDDDDDDDEDVYAANSKPLKLDSGDFTLTQLVALVTHETLNDYEAIKVLLLCHRCFSDSCELIKAIRKRFFVPPPAEAETYWNEDEIVVWCQTIQRPIQNKCVEILREWITDYFYIDFYMQPTVLHDLQLFNEQVLGCKTESNDGWYESLSLILTSSIECAGQQLDTNKLIQMQQQQQEREEKKAAAAEKYKRRVEKKEAPPVVLPDMKEITKLLKINYGFRKKKKKSIFALKSRRDEDDIALLYAYSAKQVAQQITLKDFDHFCRIHSRDFLNKVWKRKRKRGKHGGVQQPNLCVDLQQMIDRFNKINRYIVLCIVVCKRLSERVLIIQHLIDVCFTLLELHNFFSLMAVFSALDSIPISKYKYLWLRVDDQHKSLLKNIAVVCDAKSSYKQLRKLMRRSLSARLPTIPYFGVFLSDLTFVNEGASKVEGFINFKKFERFKERCKIVESFQKISYQQPKQPEANLSLCIENDIRVLNDKLSDEAQLKLLVKNGAEKDEKSATNAERQMIKVQLEKKRAKRRKRVRAPKKTI